MSANRISPLFGSSFGALLRRYREAAGLTQEALAQRAGLSVRGISDLERGARQSPRRETLDLLASALALPPHKRALLEAARSPLAPGQPPDSTARALPPNNLPAQATPLIGREREARRAAEALGRPDTRLLTLTGPGGVGKSRLALQVAEDVLERFEDGVYLVPLAALRDPALVMQAIAEAIGLRASANEPLDEQARASLRDRQTLLVLDNFEHLLAAAPRVAALLAACPRLKALVTSREPLKIAGERERAVAPLDEAAAVELFVERARAAQPSFDPASDDWETIAAICLQVDRLPLALELAAGWARLLPLPTLLERLDSRLALLSHGRRDAPERQRALRDTIAWSEQLLDPYERRLFWRLAIFSGGWTLDAAEAVCGGMESVGLDQTAPDEGVLDGLARLVEKSLALADMSPDGARFSMLETIREFARERLEASGEAEELGRRHAEYFARLGSELGWIGPRQDARDQRIERELPNIRAALAWTLARREPLIGLRLATPIGRWWYTRGAFDEAESWLRALLALDEEAGERAAPAALRVSALYALVLLMLDRRNYDGAEAMARAGLELARRHGDAARAGNMLAELGHVAEARGDLDAAMAYFEEGLAQYEQGGARQEGAAVGRTLSSLGNLARAKGDYAQAQVYLERALAWARERDFSFAVASGLVSLGHVAVEQNDYPRATTLYREALELYRTLRNPASIAWLLQGVAITVGALGNTEAVARLAGSVTSLRAVAGAAESAEWPPFARVCAAARQALGEEAYRAASERGAALGPERAITYALTLLGESAASARGDSLS
ncbi:MAG TPA: helix-turn-helix domain-containing protein [Ktedonobacterales bacterium]|nr:helix-turn-helix domain-containing protein [Ktedonobacterales bacterium]